MNCFDSTHLTSHFIDRFFKRVYKEPHSGYNQYNFEKIKISMIKIMNVHEINSFKIFKDSNKKIILPMGTKYRLVVVNNTLITILLPHHEYKMEECQWIAYVP